VLFEIISSLFSFQFLLIKISQIQKESLCEFSIQYNLPMDP